MTGWIFYHSILFTILLSPLGIFLYRYLEKEKIAWKKSVFLQQFKEMVESVAAALNVGYSAENAFGDAQKELLSIYAKDSMIQKELDLIVRKIRLQIPLEQILFDFADRVEISEVRNFATVFSQAKRSGGDMIAIIRNTAAQIGDQIDVKREIETILAAKNYEFRVMCVIPYAMIIYMRLSFPEFMEVLYGNIVGIGVMTLCLCVYCFACMLGVSLIKIEV